MQWRPPDTPLEDVLRPWLQLFGQMLLTISLSIGMTYIAIFIIPG